MAEVIAFILMCCAAVSVISCFAMAARELYWEGECDKIMLERYKNALEKEREQQ